MQAFLTKQNLKGKRVFSRTPLYKIEDADPALVRKELAEAVVVPNRRIPFKKEASEKNVFALTPVEAHKKFLQQLDAIGLAQAQETSKGQGVVVAVVDTGLDVNHQDLQANLWVNPREKDNGRDDDGNGLVDDLHGWHFGKNSGDLMDALPHGTMSASVIASSATGVAPEAKIMALGVTDADGAGNLVAITNAFLYAKEHGARIINFSMGGTSFSTLEKQLFKLIAGDDILVVQAAGNSGEHIRPVQYDFWISVSALTLPPGIPALTSYSNYGETVDLAAPSGEDGDGLVAAAPGTKNQYRLYNGTSAAAPVVSGVAALLLSAHPNLHAADLKRRLVQTSTITDDSHLVNALGALLPDMVIFPETTMSSGSDLN